MEHTAEGDAGLSDEIVEILRGALTEPPYKTHEINVDTTAESQIKRSKRKSKFSKEQDDMIISLKTQGRSWGEIAQETGVGSFLTARNRYQVLMGQQGVASTVWSTEDTESLQSLVDEGELEKWRFISRELYKLTGKFFTDVQCRDLVRELFLQDPEEFGITVETLQEIELETQGNDKGKDLI